MSALQLGDSKAECPLSERVFGRRQAYESLRRMNPRVAGRGSMGISIFSAGVGCVSRPVANAERDADGLHRRAIRPVPPAGRSPAVASDALPPAADASFCVGRSAIAAAREHGGPYRVMDRRSRLRWSGPVAPDADSIARRSRRQPSTRRSTGRAAVHRPALARHRRGAARRSPAVRGRAPGWPFAWSRRASHSAGYDGTRPAGRGAGTANELVGGEGLACCRSTLWRR